MRTHLVIPDPHAHPDFDNSRADLVGKLILDLAPEVVINLGDMWDFSSLSSYDKGKSSFYGKSYNKDLNAGLDFDDRIWAPTRAAKRRLPETIFIEGNHEYRQSRLLEMTPELQGTVSWKDLDLEKNYDEVVRYSGQSPSALNIDGILYSHYFISGVLGRPIGGEHVAYTALTKQFQSITMGHLHTFDYSERTTGSGSKIQGLVAGCFIDYVMPWAGEEISKLWSAGVAICHNVEDGAYDLEWVSMKRLRKVYG